VINGNKIGMYSNGLKWQMPTSFLVDEQMYGGTE